MCGGQGNRRPGSRVPPTPTSRALGPTGSPRNQGPRQGQVGLPGDGVGAARPRSPGAWSFSATLCAVRGSGGHEGSRTGHPQASGSLFRERTGQRAGSSISATKWALHSVPQPHPGLAGAHPQPIQGWSERVGVSTRPNSSPDGRDGSTTDGPGGAQARCFAGWTTGRPALSSAAGTRWTAPQR